jgi:hypothetical protein
MNPEPRFARDYSSRATQAVKMVLIELGQVLGEYLDSLVVVGGAVPWLLPDTEPEHVGSIDVDLALNPKKLQAQAKYANMVRLLEKAGYERQVDDLGVFQMRRKVSVDNGEPVLVILDLLKPSKPKTRRNKPALIPDFRVQDIPGAEFALANPQWLTLEGIMPDGRNNTVRLPITDLGGFLVMKGYALQGRDKPKDAYDIYYVIKHYPQGTQALAELCLSLLGHEKAKQGFQHIADKFDVLEGYGAQSVRSFLGDTFTTPEEANFVQRDAFEQVQAWLRALGLVSG